MICQRGVRLPAPTAPGLKMRPTQGRGRGRGISLRSRPTLADRSLILPPGAATWRLRRIAYAAGRSRPPCRWGDPFRAVAQRPARIRGRSAFALRGPTSPASLGRLSCACGAIRFCSARRSAPPCPALGFAALAIRSLPLARSGIYWGFGCAGCAGCAAAQPAGLVHRCAAGPL
jgi:hypothetical protein